MGGEEEERRVLGRENSSLVSPSSSSFLPFFSLGRLVPAQRPFVPPTSHLGLTASRAKNQFGDGGGREGRGAVSPFSFSPK